MGERYRISLGVILGVRRKKSKVQRNTQSRYASAVWPFCTRCRAAVGFAHRIYENPPQPSLPQRPPADDGVLAETAADAVSGRFGARLAVAPVVKEPAGRPSVRQIV